jgi:hypothetical protein
MCYSSGDSLQLYYRQFYTVCVYIHIYIYTHTHTHRHIQTHTLHSLNIGAEGVDERQSVLIAASGM